MDYVWNRDKWCVRNPEVDIDLVATDPDGELNSLKRLQSSEASEMLGVWIAPDGNHRKIVQELRKAALEWGHNVKGSSATKQEAWQALHSNISAKLKYPLPACTLSKRECQSIMAPALQAALPRAGINSSISVPIRNCPIAYGGAGVLSLFDYQGTSRTSMLVEQVSKRSPTGLLLL